MRRCLLPVCIAMVVATSGARAERLPIRAYTTADGLAHDSVTRIIADSRGFLWFCTGGGLSRFDGYTFANFGPDQGLPSAATNDLLETRSGEFWVATDEGLFRFDPTGRPERGVAYEKDPTARGRMFAVIVPDDQDRRARAITVLREGRDGAIWVGTNKGLYRLEKVGGHPVLRGVDIALPTEFPGQREITDIVEDKYGSIWVATPGGLYRRWPDGRAAGYGKNNGLPELDLSDLFEDRQGRLWIASRTGGITRVRADASHAAPVVDLSFGVADGLPTRWVTQMFETSDGRFWVATADGLGEFLPGADERGGTFRSFGMANGLSHRYISSLGEDLAGNLWLSTTNAGAMKLARNGFTTYGPSDGIESITGIFEDRTGALCFRAQVLGRALETLYPGATRDLLKRNPERWHMHLGWLDGRDYHWFYPHAITDFGWAVQDVTLRARGGEWWIGTGQGLFRFPAVDRFSDLESARPLAVYTTQSGLAGNQVYRLFEDSRGNVWVSTITSINGLARWEARTQRLQNLGNSLGLPSLKDEVPRSFGEDSFGNVWIGFKNAVARYSSGRFTLFAGEQGVPAGAIEAVYTDRSHRLWLASAQGGLVRVDNAGAERPVFVSYTTRDGLSSNNIEAIAEDRDGHLYVGGGHGIDRLDPGTGRIKHFTAADGLIPGILCAAYRDREGVLWFGLTTGMARLAPAPDKPAAPPPVLITGLRVTGVPQLVSALGEQQITLPDLASRQNQLQIDFVALGFGPGEVLRYQYQLRGADAGWSALTEHRTVNYASLAPGRYTFVVRGVNSDGTASAQPASITFRVLPPLWLRWWFLTLTAAAAGLLVHAFYRSRVARLVEMANMRTRIATDLHDDIGANLTRIVLLSEVAQHTADADRRNLTITQDAPNAAADDPPLSSIARIARESVASMSDIVWAINPARDSLIDLIRRMRRHAEDIFALRNIELLFDAPDDNAHLKLGVDIRRDLLLIFKEAINNAARHSGCSRVEIRVRMEASRLVLIVADNGAGFDPSIESVGQGLMSFRRRAKRLKGTLEILTGKGTGTTVRFSVPV